LPGDAPDRILRLLGALGDEPDPHTTVAEPAAALERHVADSLSGLEVDLLRGASRIADVGAGAGFPGLVLAIALPAAQVDLIEAAGRKTAVIERLASAAGIDNARARTVRAEEWAAQDGAQAYEAVTARAVAPLAILVEYAAPLLELGGVFVAWKGARDLAEEEAGARAAEVVGLAAGPIVEVKPFPSARDRHLHTFVKASVTPDRFPRRAGMARKRPLA
jgi:16S rRNA (guanine527-N7)-methyltransferase